jgi:hypothetical protein
MPSLDALEVFYQERQGNTVHYLADLNKEPESWEEEQQGRRV